MIFIKLISALLMLFAVIDYVLLGIVPSFAVTLALLFTGAVLGIYSIYKGNNPDKIRIPIISWLLALVFAAIYALKLPDSNAKNSVLGNLDIIHWFILAALAILVGVISTIAVMTGGTGTSDVEYDSFEG